MATYLSKLNGATASMNGYTESVVNATLRTTAFQLASAAATTFLSPVGGAIVSGILGLVETAINLFDQYNEKLLETAQAGEEATQRVRETAGSFRDFMNSADSNIPRYAELAQGVDAFGNNLGLSTEEYEEFLSLSNQLAELFPELVRGYDDNGNAILSLSGDVDTLTSSLQNLVDSTKLQTFESMAEELPTKLSGVLAQDKLNIERLEELEYSIDETANELFLPYDDVTTPFNQKYDEYFKNLGIDPSKYRTSHEDIFDKVHFDYTAAFESDEYKKAVAETQKDIDTLIKKNQQQWQSLMPVVSAWAKTDITYQGLNGQMQQIADTMIGGLDFQAINPQTAEELQDYIDENILQPLANTTPAVQEAFAQMTDWRQQAIEGEMTLSQFSESVRAAFQELVQEMDPSQRANFKDIFVSGLQSMGITGDTFDAVLTQFIADWQEDVYQASKELYQQELQSAMQDIVSLQNEAAAAISAHGQALQEFETIQEKVNTGYHFSFTEMDNLVKKYPELEGCFQRVSDGWTLQAESVNRMNLGLRFTEEEIEALKAKYGTTIDVIDDGTGALYLNSEALTILGKTAAQLKIEACESQLEITKQTLLNTGKRLGVYSKEISGIQSMADAYAAIEKINNAEKRKTQEIYDQNGWAYDNWMNSTSSWLSEEEEEAILAVGQAADDIANLQEELENLESGSLEGSGSSGNAASPAERAREEWNSLVAEKKHALAMDRLTEDEYYAWLQDTYRKYLTDEEAFLSDRRSIEEELYTWQKQQAEEQKQEQQQRLQDQLSALKEFYDEQKQLLRDQYEEEDRIREQAEKRQTVADLEREIAELSRDTSFKALKRRQELQQELEDAREELRDFERDQLLSETEQLYDDLYEQQEALLNARLQRLEQAETPEEIALAIAGAQTVAASPAAVPALSASLPTTNLPGLALSSALQHTPVPATADRTQISPTITFGDTIVYTNTDADFLRLLEAHRQQVARTVVGVFKQL